MTPIELAKVTITEVIESLSVYKETATILNFMSENSISAKDKFNELKSNLAGHLDLYNLLTRVYLLNKYNLEGIDFSKIFTANLDSTNVAKINYLDYDKASYPDKVLMELVFLVNLRIAPKKKK